jgi:hypothetical protein
MLPMSFDPLRGLLLFVPRAERREEASFLMGWKAFHARTAVGIPRFQELAVFDGHVNFPTAFCLATSLRIF